MDSGRKWRLGLYEKSMPSKLPLERKLKEARRAGYDYLELSIDETDEKLSRLDWPPAAVAGLRRASEEAGVPIGSICLSGHRRFPLGDADCVGRSLEIMEKCVSLAAALGVRVIQIAGYDVYYKASTEGTRELFAANLSRCVEMAASEGVTLGFETMETPFIDTVAKAAYWTKRMGSPYLQIYPDLGNITNAAALTGSGPAEDLETGRGHLVAVHLKETKPGVFREVPYGEGHVDFRGLARKAMELGVHRFVGEFWYTGEADYRLTLLSNREFLSAALSDAQNRCGRAQ